MTAPTDFRACACGTRILLVRKMPPLNWVPDPGGMVAVTFTHPRVARWLRKDEAPSALEHRYSVHECGAVADPAP